MKTALNTSRTRRFVCEAGDVTRAPARQLAVVPLCALSLALHAGAADAERQLTSDGLIKRDPVYVDGGQAVLYAVRAASPRLVLKRLDLHTAESLRVHPKSNLVEFRPSVSANGRTLAFQRMTGNDVCSLYVRDLATDNERVIATGRKTSFNVALSPSGRELVYNLSGQLYRRETDGSDEVKLAHSSGRNDWPAWSPDGAAIAFSSSRSGDFDIFVMNRQGDDVRRLTDAPGLDIRPAWSPDGQRIVFTSNRDQNYEIYVVNADGSNLRRVTKHAERDDYPSWHPDGKRIVFVSERNGRHDLFVRSIGDQSLAQ